MSRLRKGVADVYGRTAERNIYEPFVAARIKASEPDAPEVELLRYLPPHVAEIIAYEGRVRRGPSDEGQEEFAQLCKRYDHVGGRREQWVEYHQRCDIDGLWSY